MYARDFSLFEQPIQIFPAHSNLYSVAVMSRVCIMPCERAPLLLRKAVSRSYHQSPGEQKKSKAGTKPYIATRSDADDDYCPNGSFFALSVRSISQGTRLPCVSNNSKRRASD
jgi:hypothetical protein